MYTLLFNPSRKKRCVISLTSITVCVSMSVALKRMVRFRFGFFFNLKAFQVFSHVSLISVSTVRISALFQKDVRNFWRMTSLFFKRQVSIGYFDIL